MNPRRPTPAGPKLEELDRICTVNTALLNACRTRDMDVTLYHVLIPVPRERLREYMRFLEVDPEHYRYIAWHVRDGEGRGGSGLKDRLFQNIAEFSYHALVTYFVSYALPRAMRALKKLVDTIDPHTFREVVMSGGGVGKGRGEDKLHKA